MTDRINGFGLKWLRVGLALILLAMVLAAPAPAAKAAPVVRLNVVQHGDAVVIGNTLGQECAAGTPAPVVGTVGACGTSTADSAPDLFWRSDSPSAGQAEADLTFTSAQARTSAQLTIPAGATITHAYLHWGARWASTGTVGDPAAFLEYQAGSSTLTVTADATFIATDRYQSAADVTSFVQANGVGAYRVSDVQSNTLVNVNDANNFVGWWLAVVYERASDPLRSIIVYDGLDPVANGLSQSTNLSGFTIPSTPAVKLTVVAFEGDNTGVSDALAFNGTTLSDATNPANNFFNSSHSLFSSTVSAVGDLPQLTGAAGSMSGLDIDTVDVTSLVAPGQTSATIDATTGGDVFFLAGYVLSINTFQPDVFGATKTASDLNGGNWEPGDQVRYTITVPNTGNDDLDATVLTDTLDAGLTYVPGSLSIVSGPNAGPMTDGTSDDQAEYDGVGRRVIFRLGTNASGSQGGRLVIGASTTISFDATINVNVLGDLPN